jgi:hypothetical protein
MVQPSRTGEIAATRDGAVEMSRWPAAPFATGSIRPQAASGPCILTAAKRASRIFRYDWEQRLRSHAVDWQEFISVQPVRKWNGMKEIFFWLSSEIG